MWEWNFYEAQLLSNHQCARNFFFQKKKNIFPQKINIVLFRAKLEEKTYSRKCNEVKNVTVDPLEREYLLQVCFNASYTSYILIFRYTVNTMLLNPYAIFTAALPYWIYRYRLCLGTHWYHLFDIHRIFDVWTALFLYLYVTSSFNIFLYENTKKVHLTFVSKKISFTE